MSEGGEEKYLDKIVSRTAEQGSQSDYVSSRPTTSCQKIVYDPEDREQL